MMTRRGNIWSNLDWFTVILYIALVFLGWINIYAAVYNEQHHSILDFSQRYGKQLIWIIAAIIMALAVLLIDIKFYTFFAYIIYGLMIFLLIMVLIFGKEVHGTKAWLSFGSVQLQPSEFAKFATCLALARYLSTYNIKISNVKTIAVSLVIIFTPALLIMLQPDMGSVIVYAALILVLYREGLPGTILFIFALVPALFILALVMEKFTLVLILLGISMAAYAIFSKQIKYTFYGLLIIGGFFGILYGLNLMLDLAFANYLLLLISTGISSIVFVISAYIKRLRGLYLTLLFLVGSITFTLSVDYVFQNILKEHQQRRINILLGFEDDPQGVGYNVNQSKIAIGSGGLTGKGFLRGTQTKFDFVPEQSTDFIFCTVGEEWGFLGTSVVIILFTLLLVRLIVISERQRSTFTRIYGYGVISILFFHFLVNIGMTIGLLPVIGIPLPFFSYGGSSLWAFTILLFILLRLDASRLELLR
jgi:rod shape determining protein RodA